MTGHDAMTALVHGVKTVLAGDNETMEIARRPPCDSLPQVLAITLSPMTNSKSTTPLKVASLLPEAIANGDTPFYVVVVIDSEDGEKLVWETPMPEGATLEAALQRRLRLNSRYSVSYIAECRIIPLLTQQS